MKCLKRPCLKCPFRKDSLQGWLGEERMREICEDTVLGDQYFICHETTDLPLNQQMFCAGKMILENKVAPGANKSTRMAVAMGMMPGGYSSLEGSELIFDTVQEVIKHHKHD